MSNYNAVNESFVAELTAVVSPANISTALAERQLRAQDMSQHEARLSEVVVWPATAEQVAAVLRLANDERIPVTPWGAGSSLEGNPIPLFGGISLSMERMNRIIAIHAADFQVTVQPGLGYKDLNAALARHDLFFAPDPGANASIGGMIANNAAGSRTVKYGATKDNVLRLEVALADGRLIRTGARSIKQASGYNLAQLIIGSEGTLGVVTEATLKLAPIPSVMSAVVATFGDVATAVKTVVAVRGSGLDVAALEFIGASKAGILTRETGVDWGEQPTLLMEIHAAHPEAAELDLALMTELCREMGARRIVATADPAERKRLWDVRHHSYVTMRRVFPGCSWQLMDVAVPISAYPALVAHVETILAAHGVPGYLVGHAGDGNLHVEIPYRDEATRRQAALANDAVVEKAIALEGTSSGEHGVGIGKVKFMGREHGTAVAVMQALKATLDPNAILNPGKVLPAG